MIISTDWRDADAEPLAGVSRKEGLYADAACVRNRM
nr:MAG TPA: hypothetical protein [Caudoviricetes sp.]